MKIETTKTTVTKMVELTGTSTMEETSNETENREHEKDRKKQ